MKSSKNWLRKKGMKEMYNKDEILKDENGKPIACKVFIPSYGKYILFGVNAVAEWLNKNNILGRRISNTTIKHIAKGKGEERGYSKKTINAIKELFPDLCRDTSKEERK